MCSKFYYYYLRHSLMLVQRRAAPLDYNGKRLVVLDNMLAKADYEKCCALQIIIPMTTKREGKMAACFYCGKVFRGDMNSLGSHVYECKGEASPFRPLQSWTHRGTDCEENRVVVEALQKSLTLQAFVEYNCSHRFMGVASSDHINMISQVARVIGSSCDVDNPELFDRAEEEVNQKILQRLKQVDGCFLSCLCIHNISKIPIGMLILALDTDGVTSIVASGEYRSRKSMDADQEALFLDTLASLTSNGVHVMGFIQFGDQHCGRLVETMYEKHRKLLDGMIWLQASEQHAVWTRELQKAPSLLKIAMPVNRIINVVKSNPMFKQLLDKCLEVNKIKDFSIWDEKELNSAVNFYELWYQNGCSFFTHLEVFKVIQGVIKKNKEYRKGNPQDYDFFTSVELRSDTTAFKAAYQTLLLLEVYRSIISKWKTYQKGCTPAAAKALICRELKRVQIPEDLQNVFIDTISQDLFNAYSRVVPINDDWESFEIYLTYSATSEGQVLPPLLSQTSAETFLQSLFCNKNDQKEIVDEFGQYLNDCPMLKVNRFGEQTPYQFWKENQEKYPRLAPIAITILLLPESNDNTITLNMLDNILSNMFLHLSEKQIEPLRRLHFWFNQFRVPYLSEVEDLLP